MLPDFLGRRQDTLRQRDDFHRLWDNWLYEIPGMEIAIKEGGIDEELREEKVLHPIGHLFKHRAEAR